jgi:hypothetical protein
MSLHLGPLGYLKNAILLIFAIDLWLQGALGHKGRLDPAA